MEEGKHWILLLRILYNPTLFLAVRVGMFGWVCLKKPLIALVALFGTVSFGDEQTAYDLISFYQQVTNIYDFPGLMGTDEARKTKLSQALSPDLNTKLRDQLIDLALSCETSPDMRKIVFAYIERIGITEACLERWENTDNGYLEQAYKELVEDEEQELSRVSALTALGEFDCVGFLRLLLNPPQN